MPNNANESQKPSFAFTLWFEEALGSWILPVSAVAVMVGIGILYLVDVIPEVLTGTVVAIAAPLAATAVMVRPALELRRGGSGRSLLWAAGLATLLFSTGPALLAIAPGAPLFEGEMGIEGESIPIPPNVSGRVRVLVNGKLKDGGEPSVTFRLTGGEQPIEGKLERTFGFTRVGRGGRARVAHDHNSDWFPGKLASGATELRLAELRGQLGSRMKVAVYRDWLPHAWLILAALCALGLASVADARLGMKGNASVISGMALSFGLLVAFNATPSVAVMPSVGGIVLGAMAGSLGGAMAGWLGRKFVPLPERRPAAKSDRKGNAAAA